MALARTKRPARNKTALSIVALPLEGVAEIGVVRHQHRDVLYNQHVTRLHDLADLVRIRAAAFARFAEWEASHPMMLAPAAAVAAVGSIYEMLPPESRQRPVDTTGVARMHDAFRHLPR